MNDIHDSGMLRLRPPDFTRFVFAFLWFLPFWLCSASPQWVERNPSPGIGHHDGNSRPPLRFLADTAGGVAFVDLDGDGQKDSSEPALPGCVVRLSGVYSDSVLTDSDGRYLFVIATPGEYRVTIATDPAWEQVYPYFDSCRTVIFSKPGEASFGNDFVVEEVPVRIRIPVTVSDNSIWDRRQIWWGVRPGASTGIWGVDRRCTYEDYSEQETELPPLFPGCFDARFVNPDFLPEQFGNGSWSDIRGFLSQTQADTYAISFGPGRLTGADYPMNFSWSSQLIRRSFNGPVELMDITGNAVDMKSVENFVVSDPCIKNLVIISSSPALDSRYLNSWHLISLPREVSDPRLCILFSTCSTRGFTFWPGNGYVQTDSLRMGCGYWLKFILPLDTGYTTCGRPQRAESLSVSAGWNLVGSVSMCLPIRSVDTVPADITSSLFYGYDGGYFVADTIRPGRGYWVKFNSSGKLLLCANGIVQHPSSQFKTEGLGQIIVCDADGHEQPLYYCMDSHSHSVDRMLWEMPPAAPSGDFDARFGSGAIIEYLPAEDMSLHSIRIASSHYPARIVWSSSPASSTVALMVDEQEQALDEAGSAIVSGPASTVGLRTRSISSLSNQFDLQQNFPNPFNATTCIRYRLPERSYVSVRIIDLLGREVAILSNEIQESGSRVLTWTPAGMGSGVYFCRLEARPVGHPRDQFTSVRKIVLLK